MLCSALVEGVRFLEPSLILGGRKDVFQAERGLEAPPTTLKFPPAAAFSLRPSHNAAQGGALLRFPAQFFTLVDMYVYPYFERE